MSHGEGTLIGLEVMTGWVEAGRDEVKKRVERISADAIRALGWVLDARAAEIAAGSRSPAHACALHVSLATLQEDDVFLLYFCYSLLCQ
jgi:hypothetical protein